ncbi:hypothetical protein B9Z55_000462 [Caenorhabditis nigoni]|uniref:Uncharacterized protein n=1 Tax=Caenorhabditis nigoni TaxID=1611254 RepID=A0A2G5VT89_9PELO|nr:hypothetical protein B9Z55_000462 [Caenorhabditis nigoni]
MSRRHSVVDAYAVVDAKIRDTMNQLSNLWDEVDMKDSMRCNRVEKAFAHITQLCDDMVTGERDMVTSLRLSIREDMANVEKMRRELEMDGFQRPADIKDGSIALRRRLQAEVKDLEEEFNRRHEEQKALIEKLERLKTRLASEFQFEHDLHSEYILSIKDNKCLSKKFAPFDQAAYRCFVTRTTAQFSDMKALLRRYACLQMFSISSVLLVCTFKGKLRVCLNSNIKDRRNLRIRAWDIVTMS